MCKYKSCKYYKSCIVKRELQGDIRCSDYEVAKKGLGSKNRICEKGIRKQSIYIQILYYIKYMTRIKLNI